MKAAGLVPAIHAVPLRCPFKLHGSWAAWMAGTSPAKTPRRRQTWLSSCSGSSHSQDRRRPLKGRRVFKTFGDVRRRRIDPNDQIERLRRDRQPIRSPRRAGIVALNVDRERPVGVAGELAVAAERGSRPI